MQKLKKDKIMIAKHKNMCYNTQCVRSGAPLKHWDVAKR